MRAELAPELAEELALAALGWLAAGCAVGLLLALLLAWPDGNALLAPLTYGRWVPVHLDLMLYGWTALPLVGLLLRVYLSGASERRAGRIALAGWSGALGAGALALLAGRSSGKLFLEWNGPAEAFFLAALVLLWIALASGFGRDLRSTARPRGRVLAARRLFSSCWRRCRWRWSRRSTRTPIRRSIRRPAARPAPTCSPARSPSSPSSSRCPRCSISSGRRARPGSPFSGRCSPRTPRCSPGSASGTGSTATRVRSSRSRASWSGPGRSRAICSVTSGRRAAGAGSRRSASGVRCSRRRRCSPTGPASSTA